MKKIKLSILLLGVCLGTNVIAQDRPSESLSLINGVTTNNDLYNGAVNVTIPLFNIPVGNLTLSNEISNASNGFMPRVDESIFGLHWYANQFGSITREVNRDFLLTKYASVDAEHGLAGIYPPEGARDRETNDCIIQSQEFGNGFNPTKKRVLQDPNNSGIRSEFIPDKFYFDFFGYKGYFIFDNMGTPFVFCENAKLQVLGAASLASKCYSTIAPIDFQNKNVNEIRIIDDKGNTFYFGGSYDALEVNYSQFNFIGSYYNPVLQSTYSFSNASRANYIVSWFLKRVELNNGEIIEADYKHGDSNIFNSFTQKTLTDSSGFPTSYPTASQIDASNNEVSKSYEVSTATIDNFVSIENYTKRAIVEKIQVIGKNTTVNYNYFKDSKNLIHLGSINLNYFGKSQDITFNQAPLGGDNYRYFLTSVNKNNETYSFQYEKTDNLPPKNTYGTNDFGFWNGTSFKGIGNSSSFFNATLLKKVIYPNKGYTMFNGEKANVSKEIYENLADNISEIPINRLASKIDYDGSNEYKTNYLYQLSNGKSSGILVLRMISGKLLKQQVKYSQVQEVTENKGKIEYFFSDFATNPDDYSIKRFNTSYLFFNYKDNRAHQRGKLFKKNIFDATNKLLEEHQYEYQSFLRSESELVDLGLINCTTCKLSDDAYYVLTAIDRSSMQNGVSTKTATMYAPVIPYLLKKEKIINYLNDKQVSVETDTKYRESNIFWHPYPEEIQITTAAGISIKKYVYPYELKTGCPGLRGCSDDNTIVGGQFASYSTMVNSNIWTPVIEIVKNENNKYSLQENLFHTWPIVPKKIRNSKLNADLDFTNYKISLDKTVDQVNYDVIDNRGNYIQTTDKLGIPTVTIYGYKQSLPILKITGLTYAQLMQTLGQSTSSTDYLNLSIVTKSNADIDTSSEQSLIDELNTVRNNQSLKSYPITTYTYDPLIGVTSVIPPSGVRENYIYDSAGRLQKIVDVNGLTVKEMKYNYKN
ncbi:hypothetical protein [Chryseobacterium sp. KCF3-3]|uniref:hypothetical protein n=1 Tax=Chryseobacterium sp. KCF3-3 TaxID=3231511 RepID=UPI0038B3B7B4